MPSLNKSLQCRNADTSPRVRPRVRPTPPRYSALRVQSLWATRSFGRLALLNPCPVPVGRRIQTIASFPDRQSTDCLPPGKRHRSRAVKIVRLRLVARIFSLPYALRFHSKPGRDTICRNNVRLAPHILKFQVGCGLNRRSNGLEKPWSPEPK